jgi:hypothetical protein
MFRYSYLFLLVLLTPICSSADSIRVGDTSYRDVYIGVSADYYYIHHPGKGERERISRRRSDISDVVIDTDPARRDALLAQYRTAKTGGTLVAEKTPVELGGDVVQVHRFRKEMRNMAVFESQFSHWRSLSPETRELIQEGLQESLVLRAEKRAIDHENSLVRLEELDAEKAAVENELESAAIARETAVARAEAENGEGRYLDAYRSSRVRVGPYYQYYQDYYGNIRTVPRYWYERDETLYDAATEERYRTQQRIEAAELDYADQAAVYGSQYDSVQGAISRRAQDVRATVSKSQDEQRRYGFYLGRIAALEEAEADGYQPRLRASTLASWNGSGNQKTPSFTVASGIWRIDCRGVEGDLADSFSVTVFDAERGVPFTRIAGADFLGMRSRVFDESGSYYLVVEQGLGGGHYEIRVDAISAR